MNNYPRSFVEKYTKKRYNYLKSLTKVSNDYNIAIKNRKAEMYSKVQKVQIPFKSTLFDGVKRCLKRYDMVPIAKICDKLSCFVKKKGKIEQKN